jgi:phage virion morphogenesis protein
MPEIIITMDGADVVREKLREISSRVSNLSPVLKMIGDRIVEQTKRRFEAGGPAPSGVPWAAPKTPNPKRVRTLTVSGHLRDSIRFQLRGNDTVVVGTNKEYAAIHQLGGKTAAHLIMPRNKKALKTPYGIFKKISHPGSAIPARPYLGLSTENSDEIIGMINEYIAGR